MMTLIAAALAAAQPATAPAADAHAQHSAMQHGQAATGQHDHHEGMKDCCKHCCKDMKGHEGHMSKGGTTPKRAQ